MELEHQIAGPVAEPADIDLILEGGEVDAKVAVEVGLLLHGRAA